MRLPRTQHGWVARAHAMRPYRSIEILFWYRAFLGGDGKSAGFGQNEMHLFLVDALK